MRNSAVVKSSIRFAGFVALITTAAGSVLLLLNKVPPSQSSGARGLLLFLATILVSISLAAVVMLLLGVWPVEEPSHTKDAPVDPPSDPAWAALLVIKTLIDSDNAKTMAPELKLAVIEDVVRRIVRIRFPEGEKPNKGDQA